MSWLLALLACGGVPPAAPAPPEADQCAHASKVECWVRVPGGTFLRGAQATDPAGPGHDPDAADDEGPVRQVTVSPFWIHQHEVLHAAWDRCVCRGACEPAQHTVDPRDAARQTSDVPLRLVTWEGARQVCAFLGGRLPTEAEWEFAARGADGRRFPWGDEPACGTGRSRSQGTWGFAMDPPPCRNADTLVYADLRGPSPFGVVGMAGNVAEWVADGYHADAYATGSATDPVAPDAPLRVVRGGSWIDPDPVALRAAARGALDPAARLPDVGVRCVFGR